LKAILDMTTASTEKYIWPLLFAGLFICGLGFAVGRSDDTLGWVMNFIGSVLMLVGAVMLWMRSRARSKA
jgi:uncharacterized membrane protein YccC